MSTRKGIDFHDEDGNTRCNLMLELSTTSDTQETRPVPGLPWTLTQTFCRALPPCHRKCRSEMVSTSMARKENTRCNLMLEHTKPPTQRKNHLAPGLMASDPIPGNTARSSRERTLRACNRQAKDLLHAFSNLRHTVTRCVPGLVGPNMPTPQGRHLAVVSDPASMQQTG